MGALDDAGLGFVNDVLDPFTGGGADKAAKDAARAGRAAGREARDVTEAAQFRLEEGLQPFTDFGVSQGIDQLPGSFGQLQSAISDPSSAVLNNPFFQALSADQDQRLLASRAARGKVGSGGTDDALERQQLLLGNQFAQQNIGNIQGQIQNQFNAAQVGQSSAAQVGVSGLNTANQVGGIIGNMGNVTAAGIIGRDAAKTQGANNLLSLATAGFTGGLSLLGGGGGVPFLGGGSSPPPPTNSGFQFA